MNSILKYPATWLAGMAAPQDGRTPGCFAHFLPLPISEHGFGQLAGELPHARAFAGGENDSFHSGYFTMPNSFAACVK